MGDRTNDVSYYHQALESSLKGAAINRQLAARNRDQVTLRRLVDGLADVGILRWKCCRDLAGALRDVGEALSGFERLAGREPQNLEARRDVADVNEKLGVILGEAGRRVEALEADRKALAIYEELGRADPSSGENVGHLAAIRAQIAAVARKSTGSSQSQ